MIKTFIDSGVLIFAARGEGELAEKAVTLLITLLLLEL